MRIIKIMEVNKVLENVSGNKKIPVVGEGKESIDELKSSLKKQIDQLKLIISQIEWNLSVIKFGKTKHTFHSNQITENLNDVNIPNIGAWLKYELCRYSGFYCVYCSKQGQVFNFLSSNKYDAKNIYVAQILNNQNKPSLGKWIMPMGIDLDDLVSDFPIDKLKNVPRFLRICKFSIHCYFVRCEQYATLMSIVSSTKNCNLQTNVGYTLIILELTNVCNENDNTIIGIAIYLVYDINEIRPYKVRVDSTVKQELDKNIKKHLQKCLQQFKSYDLHTAFENMLNMKPFVWTKEADEDSLLQINSASESDDDGYLASILLQPKRRKTLRIRNVQLMEGTRIAGPNTRKKKKYSERSIPIKNKRPESTSIENNLKRKRSKRATSTSSSNGTKLEDNNDENRTNNESNNSISLDTATSVNEKINEWSAKPFTSTPIRSKKKGFSNLTVLSNVNISDITVSESNSTAAGKSDSEGGQFQKNTSKKLLRNKMKRK
ncbi:unnamed protein product [Xylocopa violacea]|uniref:Uncharacterized protein n=1 Tax=Xylocopa violacea TaxID=135666 RepID=A0ABP1N166_XYLVO